MKIIILAGGKGTRLWPISREAFPKQFLKLNQKRSLLQQSIERFLIGRLPKDLLIVTSESYYFLVKSQVKEINPDLLEQIVVEPEQKNTAPAILFAVKQLQEVQGIEPDEPILVSSSDYWIDSDPLFLEAVNQAEVLAKTGKIVTFGAVPTKPETGYGYILVYPNDLKSGEFSKEAPCIGTRLAGAIAAKLKKFSDAGRFQDSGCPTKLKPNFSSCLGIKALSADGAFPVQAFIEKPNLERAEEFVRAGNYFWNCGIFTFTFATLKKELERYSPLFFDKLSGTLEALRIDFSKLPNVSIDYELMEKSDSLSLIPFKCNWSDVGSWDTFFDLTSKDLHQNVMIGNIHTIDTKNCLIVGGKRLISMVGLEDMLVVETEDALFLGKRGESQRIKGLVAELKERGNKEVREHLTSHRPWGHYKVLETGPRYKVKRIMADPGQQLSLQLHYHRSEHWVVVQGTAKVTIGDTIQMVHENQSIYVPKGTAHRLENPGKVPLELIEVQVGEYLEEDDIVRLEDVYGRQ